jgi:hypothetical protein
MGERGHELGGADEDLVLGDEPRKGRLGYGGGGFIAGSANGLEPCQSTGSRGGMSIQTALDSGGRRRYTVQQPGHPRRGALT